MTPLPQVDEQPQGRVVGRAVRGRPSPALRAELSALSEREREILLQISQAKSNPEIATALNIPEKTVRNHAFNVFRKLDIKSRSEAVLYMHRNR